MGCMNRRGAETFIMNIYRKIDRTQVQFDFLVYEDQKQDYEDEIISLGGRVIHRPCQSGIMGIKSISIIKKVINEYGPYSVIHAQTLFNICYAMLAALSYPKMLRISHSHCTQNRVSPNILVRCYEWASLKIIRKYTQVMCACGEEAGEFLFGSEFKERGIVLSNGIDLGQFCNKDEAKCNEILKKLELENYLVIGSVARFFQVKNHEFMVKIACVLRSKGVKFKMLLVGEGELKEDIQKQINDCGLQNEVICLGVRSDISDLMHVFDVFLMPSYFEGNPVTLVEAQAAGLPCVITDNITENIDMGLQLINRCSLSDTPEAWAETILKASNSRVTDVKKIANNIRHKGYEAQSTADQLLNIYLS